MSRRGENRREGERIERWSAEENGREQRQREQKGRDLRGIEGWRTGRKRAKEKTKAKRRVQNRTEELSSEENGRGQKEENRVAQEGGVQKRTKENRRLWKKTEESRVEENRKEESRRCELPILFNHIISYLSHQNYSHLNVDKNEWICGKCGFLNAEDGTDLVLCDGPCLGSFHLGCLDPATKKVRCSCMPTD